MADLTTLINVKNYLRISSNTDDVLLSRLISSATQFIFSYISRDITVKDCIDKFSGNNQDYHAFFDYPVNSIKSILIDGVPVVVEDYNDDQVVIKGLFTKGRLNCIVNYNAGYAVIPKDLEQACIEMVSIKYKNIEHIDVSSKSIAGETTSFITKDMPDYVKVVLNQYKKVSMN